MSLVVPNAGELALLDLMLKTTLSTNEDQIFHLYKNDYTPTSATTSTDFTEADFTNYTNVTLSRSVWNTAVTVSGKAESSYGSSPLSFTCGTTGNTIYGYWVQGATSNTVLFAEKFGSSRVLANGDILNISPKFTLSSES